MRVFCCCCCYWCSNIGQCVILLRWGTIIWKKKLVYKKNHLYYLSRNFEMLSYSLIEFCLLCHFSFSRNISYRREMILTKQFTKLNLCSKNMAIFSVMAYRSMVEFNDYISKENKFRPVYGTTLWISKAKSKYTGISRGCGI